MQENHGEVKTIGFVGAFAQGIDGDGIPNLLVELEGFVRLEGESVEGTGGDVGVGVDVVALDAYDGGILVEIAARDFDVERNFHARGGVLGGLKVDFAGCVGGDDVTRGDEVVNKPEVIGFF